MFTILIWLRRIANLLLVFAAILLLGELDWAASKNNHLAWERKSEIEKLQTIDSVKAYAKNEVDLNRKSFKERSRRAAYTFWLLIASVGIKGGLALYKSRSEAEAEELPLP